MTEVALTPGMAGVLRAMLIADSAGVTLIGKQKSLQADLARSGLVEEHELTRVGRAIAILLGQVPRDPWGQRIDGDVVCTYCDDNVDARLIAWDLYDVDYAGGFVPSVPCITCAVEEQQEKAA